jgi:hypothetical protein
VPSPLQTNLWQFTVNILRKFDAWWHGGPQWPNNQLLIFTDVRWPGNCRVDRVAEPEQVCGQQREPQDAIEEATRQLDDTQAASPRSSRPTQADPPRQHLGSRRIRLRGRRTQRCQRHLYRRRHLRLPGG